MCVCVGGWVDGWVGVGVCVCVRVWCSRECVCDVCFNTVHVYNRFKCCMEVVSNLMLCLNNLWTYLLLWQVWVLCSPFLFLSLCQWSAYDVSVFVLYLRGISVLVTSHP